MVVAPITSPGNETGYASFKDGIWLPPG